jgi:hypothetical protein
MILSAYMGMSFPHHVIADPHAHARTQVAMSGLDSMMAHLIQRRKTCGDQIEADLAEVSKYME